MRRGAVSRSAACARGAPSPRPPGTATRATSTDVVRSAARSGRRHSASSGEGATSTTGHSDRASPGSRSGSRLRGVGSGVRCADAQRGQERPEHRLRVLVRHHAEDEVDRPPGVEDGLERRQQRLHRRPGCARRRGGAADARTAPPAVPASVSAASPVRMASARDGTPRRVEQLQRRRAPPRRSGAGAPPRSPSARPSSARSGPAVAEAAPGRSSSRKSRPSSRSGAPTSPRRALDDLQRLGRLLGHHGRHARLEDAGLLPRDGRQGVAQVLHVVERHGRHRGHRGPRGGGGVQPAAQAHLQHRDVHLLLREVPERHQRAELEVRQRGSGAAAG